MFSRGGVAALALAIAVGLGAPAADAKVGGGSSFGSRGSRTFSPPSATMTAPRSAQPMQRTETSPSLGNPGLGSPGYAGAPRRFGFGTGLMAGLFGAGLLGLLSGHGFFGGLAGVMSFFGMLFQLALIAGIVWFALRLFRGRGQPVMAGGMAGTHARSAPGTSGPLPGGAGPVPGGPAGRPGVRDEVGIRPEDYTAFERALESIQTAYGREDMSALSQLVTPEMLRYLSSDLEANRSRGLRNEVTQPRLLQGDLAEAWREGPTDYATVAMRFSVIDTMVDRATGRTVSGDAGHPVESTEIWTFRRDRNGPWLLSGIQQTS